MADSQASIADNVVEIGTDPNDGFEKGLMFLCPKHGNVSQSTVAIKYAKTDSDGNKKTVRKVYCMACLDEILEGWQNDGKIQKITVKTISLPPVAPKMENYIDPIGTDEKNNPVRPSFDSLSDADKTKVTDRYNSALKSYLDASDRFKKLYGKDTAGAAAKEVRSSEVSD